MDTLKNFSKYVTYTYTQILQENGSTYDIIPFPPERVTPGASPSYPSDPTNPFSPGAPRTNKDIITNVDQLGNTEYNIYYNYVSEFIVAFQSSSRNEPIFDNTLPYIAWDQSGYLLLKNFGGTGCQLCIEDTDYGVPPLSYINQRYSTGFTPGVMTQELKAILDNEGGSKLYMPGVIQEEATYINGGGSANRNILNYINPNTWDYKPPLLDATDISIIEQTLQQVNLWFFRGSQYSFDQTQGWRTLFSSLMTENNSGCQIMFQDSTIQNVQPNYGQVGWMTDFNTTQRGGVTVACLYPYNNRLVQTPLSYNMQIDQNTGKFYGNSGVGLIRIKDPSRCIYAS